MKLSAVSVALIATGAGIRPCLAMSKSHMLNLRNDAHAMFHHGYDAYMSHAFPADEIRPLSCTPLSRAHEPDNFGLTDVLGNYSLTAIDSLSALAILSSSSEYSLEQFWKTVQSVVELYYQTGFDRDSKVQVFETVIRGVGGLVSAHEFAVGLLPMGGTPGEGTYGWKYDNQLLHLAHDLATRLLPAFTTKTGLPYPRVNLRWGCVNVRLAEEDGEGPGEKCRKDAEEAEKAGFKPLKHERTETCAAGAGSLTLEFSTLSRLLEAFKLDNPEEVEKLKKQGGLKHQWDDVEIFERVSQKAFWAVWERRSSLNLIGAGLDAVTGEWEPNSGVLAGIGASTDSFFEYAMKTYILLSSSPTVPSESHPSPSPAQAYLDVFETSVAAINKYMLVESPAVYYQGVNMATGDTMVQWVDSLSAFWPGLMVLGGEVALAERTALFYTALWQRHKSLPERYVPIRQAVTLQWWPGRPEFAESIYHIYRATKDVWYLRVGEMILRDIQRQCWGRCGWGGLQDVRNGEVSDRMESFLLSETAAYLYLLFDEENPLHAGDKPWVFTTEGHPIIMPPSKRTRRETPSQSRPPFKRRLKRSSTKTDKSRSTCENPKVTKPGSNVGELFSRTASRKDTFHSYNAVGLNMLPDNIPRKPTKISYMNNENILQEFGYYNDKDEENPYRRQIPYSPTNGSFYPWTLPLELIAPNSYCDKLPNEHKMDLLFTTLPVKAGEVRPPGWIEIGDGVMINSLSGLRISFAKEVVDSKIEYLVTKIGDRQILKDEAVVIDKTNLDALQVDNGIRFRTSRDEGYEIIVDYEAKQKPLAATPIGTRDTQKQRNLEIKLDGEELEDDELLKSIEELLRDSFKDQAPLDEEVTVEPPPRTLKALEVSPNKKVLIRRHLHGITSSGIGAVASPPLISRSHQFLRSMEYTPSPTLQWRAVYAAGLACDSPLPSIAATYPVILIRRGKCTFSQKLNNIPTSNAIKMVIVVNFEEKSPTHSVYEDVVDYAKGGGVNDWHAMRDEYLIRPLVDQYQIDSRNGQRRKNPVPLVLVGGGEPVYNILAEAKGIGLRERWKVTLDNLVIGNMVPVI